LYERIGTRRAIKMRKFSLILFLSIVIILTACQNNEENNRSNNSIDEEVEEQAAEEENPHEGKDTLSLSDIEKNELYRWEIDSEKAIVLVNKDGEIEENTAPSMLGEEGDELFSGSVAFYLVYDGEDEGYLED